MSRVQPPKETVQPSMGESALTYPIAPESIPDRVLQEGNYEVSFARDRSTLDEILRLRFEVFNVELSEGLDESWQTGRDRDPFDDVCHHLLVRSLRDGKIVGTYRMQTSAMANANLGFYSQAEFDLRGLPDSVRGESVELGRACVAQEHRNKHVLFLLWKGLALYVAHNQLRYFFGCCSLTSQDPVEGRAVMAYLESAGLLVDGLRVEPQPGFACYPPELPADPDFEVDIPRLFRTYLRHGAKICGPPAIDREFKTIDYLVLFDIAEMSEKRLRMFFR
ncbi:MAG: GNAT family N-acetyltransferase [Thermoanaerobaculia bacterium]|nr:GNAT family N-acetyltransferase [Thermoanaerobaculia bacterium]